MKTLQELADEIKKAPEKVTELLTSFRTASTEVRDFLFSLQQVPVYMVPALIETFTTNHRENRPTKIADLMDSMSYVGSIFVLCEDETDWTYEGKTPSGKAMCRPLNSQFLLELSPEKEIKHVF